MMLSYGWRVACIAFLSFGAIQVILDTSLWLASPVLLRAFESNSVRFREKFLFVAQLATHGFAFVIAFFLLAPQYVRYEINVTRERVGWVCLLMAASLLGRYLYGAYRALAIWLGTYRWQRKIAGETSLRLPGAPVICISDRPATLALAGVFTPRIVVSQDLLTGKNLSPAALEVALEHEHSHARNRDNLKLLLLSSLPHLGLSATGRPSLLRQWHSLAEFAADADAVGDSPARSVLLAEALVTVARMASRPPSRVLSMSLLTHEEELENRVGRLLVPAGAPSCGPTRSGRFAKFGALFLAAGICALFGLVLSSWQVLAEYLLHLG